MAIEAQMYPENLGLQWGGSLDWLIDTTNHNSYNNNFLNGCGFNDFSFNLQQKKHHQFQQQQRQLEHHFVQIQNLHQRNQNQLLSSYNVSEFLPPFKNLDNNTAVTSTITTTSSSDYMPINFSQSLATQLDKQRMEIDRYISLQNERLKVALQEQRKEQVTTLIRKIEEKAMVLLKEKDEEIAKARKKTMELEGYMRKMEVENQGWQRVAAENQAKVVSLNNTLEQLKEQAACFVNGVDDAESYCDDNNRGQEKVVVGTTTTTTTGEMMVCRVCNYRKASVLLLPCRHLCSCKACEAFLDACPLCTSLKKATIEALIS